MLIVRGWGEKAHRMDSISKGETSGWDGCSFLIKLGALAYRKGANLVRGRTTSAFTAARRGEESCKNAA